MTGDNIMFASIDMLVPDRNKILMEIDNVDEKYWFWESFRATSMLPLMTKNKGIGIDGSSNKIEGEFNWTSFTPPTIVKWFDDIVFPFLGMKTRIMLLRTEPFAANNEHSDCGRDKIGTTQHKFRWVLSGKTSTLYFITKSGNIFAPETDSPFIMDGAWPHGMINNTNLRKYTIVGGAPWNGNSEYGNDINILLSRTHYELPDDCTKYC